MRWFAFPACLFLFLSCSDTNGEAERPPDLPVAWEITDGVQAPESVYFDADSGFLFVSQIDRGDEETARTGIRQLAINELPDVVAAFARTRGFPHSGECSYR